MSGSYSRTLILSTLRLRAGDHHWSSRPPWQLVGAASFGEALDMKVQSELSDLRVVDWTDPQAAPLSDLLFDQLGDRAQSAGVIPV